MRIWQRRALMSVYAALNRLPAGFGASASTTARALMQAARVRADVVPKCMVVLESLANDDPRDDVESDVAEMTKALDEILAALDREDAARDARSRRDDSRGGAA